jgi:hypothetical protein
VQIPKIIQTQPILLQWFTMEKLSQVVGLNWQQLKKAICKSVFYQDPKQSQQAKRVWRSENALERHSKNSIPIAAGFLLELR